MTTLLEQEQQRKDRAVCTLVSQALDSLEFDRLVGLANASDVANPAIERAIDNAADAVAGGVLGTHTTADVKEAGSDLALACLASGYTDF